MILETECIITKSNGSQFRQVYSSFSLQSIHSQTLRENKQQMHDNQLEVISNWACLFIISSFENHSLIPVKHNRNWHSIHSILPFQSLPKKAHSQSHTLHNQRRTKCQSSILLLSHNSSNRNDDLDHYPNYSSPSWSNYLQSPLSPTPSFQSTSLPSHSRSSHHQSQCFSTTSIHSHQTHSIQPRCNNSMESQALSLSCSHSPIHSSCESGLGARCKSGTFSLITYYIPLYHILVTGHPYHIRTPR